MKRSNRILILYHSGTGSTKTIAEIYHEVLAPFGAELESVSFPYDYGKLRQYDFFVFAFPTYHGSPSRSMLEFLKGLPPFSERKRAFVFTTCGLNSANAVREFWREIGGKNVTVCGHGVYRAPATDGALLLPAFPFMLRYERQIVEKLRGDIKQVIGLLESGDGTERVPPYKLYSLFNLPNQKLGKRVRNRMTVRQEACIRCGQCSSGCAWGCWDRAGQAGDGRAPQYDPLNCEGCFRCIHHCPREAILLSARTARKPKLNAAFYRRLKEQMLRELY